MKKRKADNYMKGLWRRQWNKPLAIGMIILMLLFLKTTLRLYGINGFTATTDKAFASVGEEVPSSSNLTSITLSDEVTMDVDYGYDHYAKYGRYMNVMATISNEGDNFYGWLQVVVTKEEDNVVYRKEVRIDANTSEAVSIAVPVVGDTGILQVKLLNDNKKTVVEKDCKIKIGNYYKHIYIGVLSDDYEKLEYLDTLETKTFHLNESNITEDYLGLELLDILVVNHYDTNQLSDKQIEAVNNWVVNGGTLVLGTGEYSKETLAKFQNNYSIAATGTTKVDTISFGMDQDLIQTLKKDILNYEEARKILLQIIKDRNKSLESFGNQPIELEETMTDHWAKDRIAKLRVTSVDKKISKVQLEEGSAVVVEKDNILMQKKTAGLGMVQLFSFDIGLNQDSQSLGAAILSQITKGMSNTKLIQLQNEYYGTYVNSGIYSSMSYTDKTNIPKVSGYILVLVLYILIVGPITYLVLKKIDKRTLTWVVVPAVGLVFTFLIYLLGTKTRITEPYIGYVELITFEEDNKAKEEVYFSLTAPYNHKYNLEIDKQYRVTELKNSNYNYYNYHKQPDKEVDYDNYMTSINDGYENNILEINNNPAFSPVYYQTKNTFSMANLLTYDLSYTGDRIKGTVTNGFGVDLTNVMLLSDGYIIHLGNIKKGETISLQGKEAIFLPTRDDLYTLDIINLIAGGTGEAKDNDDETNRKSNVLYYLTEMNGVNSVDNGMIIGFVEDVIYSAGNNLIDQLSQDMVTYGTRAVVIPISPDYTKEGKTFVPSINRYVDRSDEYYNIYSQLQYLTSDNMTVEYQFPTEDQITSFEYLVTRNQAPASEYLRKFKGEIYFLNNNTGNFDEVFQLSAGSKETNLKDYLTDKNTITIRYNTEMTLQGSQMLLPSISYWRD